MTKHRIKDIRMQLQEETKMVNEQVALIKRLYTEQDDLVRQTKVLNKENKLLQARCTEWQKRALELTIELTNVRADFDILSEAERKRI